MPTAQVHKHGMCGVDCFEMIDSSVGIQLASLLLMSTGSFPDNLEV